MQDTGTKFGQRNGSIPVYQKKNIHSQALQFLCTCIIFTHQEPAGWESTEEMIV